MADQKTLKIADFKSKLVGGGARSNLFSVNLSGVVGGAGWDAEEFSFLCKAAQLPASNIGPIDVPFRGRVLKVAGDRTFEPWTVTVINDTNFKIRNAFEKWMNEINSLANNSGKTNLSDYVKPATVQQLDRSDAGGTGKVIREYNFIDMFPTNVSAIDLSYDNTDSIEEFTVEFQFQYFEIKKGADGKGDDIS